MWENKEYKGNLQACSLAPLPRIHVTKEVIAKIEMLMDRYPSTEWVGYLTGNTQDKEHYYITGISIPPHVSRGRAYAEVKPLHQPDNCIGLIHSHNSMGAFHSSVDNDYVDDNYTISCTVSKKINSHTDFSTIVNVITPCNRNVQYYNVMLEIESRESVYAEWLKEAVANIEMGSLDYTVSRQYTHSLGLPVCPEEPTHDSTTEAPFQYTDGEDTVTVTPLTGTVCPEDIEKRNRNVFFDKRKKK